MNFVGVTVEEKVPYIHFPSNTHTFAPVAVGEKRCPKQLYELYNGGSVPVKFEINCAPLGLLKADNFDHNVMECLNPEGVIPPGKTHLVEWMFYPLEAKTYQVSQNYQLALAIAELNMSCKGGFPQGSQPALAKEDNSNFFLKF